MEYFKWRSLPEDKRPKTPADIEMEAFVPVPKTKKKFLVEAAQSQLVDPILHPNDFKGLKTLLEKASNMQLDELIIKKGDFNLALKSGGNGSSGSESASSADEQAKPAAEVHNEAEEVTKNVTEKKDAEVVEKVVEKVVENAITEYENTINAVMAGTFYHSTGIDKPPLVEEGSIVNKGDTLFILEAMKLFNEIKASVKCKIIKILVKNGDTITKDQPIMAIKEL